MMRPRRDKSWVLSTKISTQCVGWLLVPSTLLIPHAQRRDSRVTVVPKSSVSHRKDFWANRRPGSVTSQTLVGRDFQPPCFKSMHKWKSAPPDESFDWSVIQSFDAFYLPNSPPWLFALAISFLPSLCIIAELCSDLINSSIHVALIRGTTGRFSNGQAAGVLATRSEMVPHAVFRGTRRIAGFSLRRPAAVSQWSSRQ